MVAGSGVELRGLLDTSDWERPFTSFPELKPGNVTGHSYAFVHGECAGRAVILQRGRLHAYEGYSLPETVRPVEILYELGVRTLLFTNAAGGLTPDLRAGDLVAADQVRTWPHPPYGLPETLRPDFVVPGCSLAGCYAWMHGPCYETRAEISLLQAMGCAAVGMSAAPELLRCQQLGIRAGLISCITNSCAIPQKLTHEHVLQAAQNASEELCALIRRFIAQ